MDVRNKIKLHSDYNTDMLINALTTGTTQVHKAMHIQVQEEIGRQMGMGVT
jgi:hypothetical protein